MNRNLPFGKRFHAFFIYREVEADRSWVQQTICRLEQQNVVCGCHERDFVPGVPILKNIENSLRAAMKIVIVFSKAFFESQWCEFELNLAHAFSLNSDRHMVIPVLLDDCKIPEFILTTTHLNVSGDTKIWWPKLYTAILYDADSLSTPVPDSKLQPLINSLKHLMVSLKSSSIETQLHFLQPSKISGLSYFVSQVGEEKMYNCLMCACGLISHDDNIVFDWSTFYKYLLNEAQVLKGIGYYLNSNDIKYSRMTVEFTDRIDCTPVNSWIKNIKTFAEQVLWRPMDRSRNIKPILDFCGHDDNFVYIEAQLNEVLHQIFPSCFSKIGYPFYKSYQNRVSTFKTWSSKSTKNPAELSSAGFFYSGFTDLVGCYSCGIRLYGWTRQDDPWEIHAYYCPSCPHIVKNRSRLFIENSVSLHTTQTTQKKREEFSSFESRLETFDCCIFDYVDPIDLADAGFYYCVTWKISDNVKCFSCGLSLHDWLSKENPWVEHAKWSPSCEYVLKQKGVKFVDLVASRCKSKKRKVYEIRFSFEEPLRVDEMLQWKTRNK